jgi:hypothetical protein
MPTGYTSLIYEKTKTCRSKILYLYVHDSHLGPCIHQRDEDMRDKPKQIYEPSIQYHLDAIRDR